MASPILVEEIILDDPDLIKIQFLCQTIISPEQQGQRKEAEEGREVAVLVVEALDGA